MTEKLTRNQSLVYEALRASGKPMGAYALLDALRDAGLRAPPQVYRALDKLIATGRVHKLQTLNAYVVCDHEHDDGETAIFAICQECDHVQELHNGALDTALRSSGDSRGFTLDGAMVELRGICADCGPGADKRA